MPNSGAKRLIHITCEYKVKLIHMATRLQCEYAAALYRDCGFESRRFMDVSLVGLCCHEVVFDLG
jgi:hypothetical protein